MSSETPITNDDLQAFADEMLAPPRRAEVAAHLERHPEAAAYVQRIVEQNRRLRAAAAPLLAPEIPRHLKVDRLFERQRAGAGFTRWAAPRPQIAAALVAGLALGGLLGGLGGWSFHPSAPSFRHGLRPLVEEAADTYAVYEPDRLHPVEVAATDKGDLMRWVTDRLRRPISAPDAILSYKLLGGRVVATTRGPAAMFMYEHDGRRIVLMICPLSLHGSAPISASAQGDVTGVSWSDRGVGYSIVGPLSSEVLQRLGEAVRHDMSDKA